MIKLKLIICCIPIFLCCGMYYSVRPIIPPSKIIVPRVQASAGYWLYFRLEDRFAGSPKESAGRSKKGDLVQVLQVDWRSIPTVKEQQSWGIIKVDSISAQDIAKFTSSWDDTVIVGKDTTITAKAYRRWMFDVDSLSISKGLDTTKVLFAPVKTKKIRKTSVMLLEYERKCKIIRYQQFVLTPIKNVFNWIVKPLFAAEQITTCNRVGEDYNTIVLWEDAEDGAMTTGNPDVLELYDDDGILANGTRVDINGWTNNDASTQIIVRTASGEKHTGTDSTGFQRENTGGNISHFFIREEFTIIQDLDLNGLASDVSAINIADFSNTIIRNNLIWNQANAGIQVAAAADADFEIFNNVIYDVTTGIAVETSVSGVVYNNTVGETTAHGIRANYSAGGDSTLFSNNAVFATSTFGDFSGSALMRVGSTDNCSGDATADDNALLNGIISVTDTDQFTAVAQPNRDFSVKDNAAAIYNDGADLSGTLIDDIIGTSRPQDGIFDIGAFELIVAAAGRRKIIIF